MPSCNNDHIPIQWCTNCSCPVCRLMETTKEIYLSHGGVVCRMEIKATGYKNSHVYLRIYDPVTNNTLAETFISVMDLIRNST